MTIICRSFNGWPVSRDPHEINAVTWTLNGIDRKWTTVACAQPVFARIVRRFDSQVDRVVGGIFDDWSYNVRPARTQAANDQPRSNHGSATAIDINSAKYPAKVRRMSKAQVAACLRIEAEFGGLVTWGGTWSDANADQMHWELSPRSTVASVRAKVKELGLLPDGTLALAESQIRWSRPIHFPDPKRTPTHDSGADVEFLLSMIHPQGTTQLAAAKAKGIPAVLDTQTAARIADTQSHHPLTMGAERRARIVGKNTWDAITGQK